MYIFLNRVAISFKIFFMGVNMNYLFCIFANS